MNAWRMSPFSELGLKETLQPPSFCSCSSGYSLDVSTWRLWRWYQSFRLPLSRLLTDIIIRGENVVTEYPHFFSVMGSSSWVSVLWSCQFLERTAATIDYSKEYFNSFLQIIDTFQNICLSDVIHPLSCKWNFIGIELRRCLPRSAALAFQKDVAQYLSDWGQPLAVINVCDTTWTRIRAPKYFSAVWQASLADRFF